MSGDHSSHPGRASTDHQSHGGLRSGDADGIGVLSSEIVQIHTNETLPSSSGSRFHAGNGFRMPSGMFGGTPVPVRSTPAPPPSGHPGSTSLVVPAGVGTGPPVNTIPEGTSIGLQPSPSFTFGGFSDRGNTNPKYTSTPFYSSLTPGSGSVATITQPSGKSLSAQDGSRGANPSEQGNTGKPVQMSEREQQLISIIHNLSRKEDPPGVSKLQNSPSQNDRFSESRWSAEKQLAISSIKSNTLAKKFDGIDASAYRRWRASLEDELRDLRLSSRVWLEILELRTASVANDMVKRAQDMEMEDPDAALEYLWEVFDRRFKSHPQAVMKLLRELQNFSKISVEQPDYLWVFALACQQAEKLMTTEQGKPLGILDYPDAQLSVTEKLDRKLWDRWMRYGSEASAYAGAPIPFKRFAEWIFRIAETYSDPNFIRKSIYTPRPKKDSFYPPRTPTPPPSGGGFNRNYAGTGTTRRSYQT